MRHITNTKLAFVSIIISLLSACAQDGGGNNGGAAQPAPGAAQPTAQPEATTPDTTITDAQPDATTPDTTVTDAQPQPDATPDAQPDNEPEPEQDNEQGGDDDFIPAPTVAQIAVDISPERAVYAPGESVRWEAEALDEQGFRVDATLTQSVEPAGAAQAQGDGWTLMQEGEVTLTACADGVCAQRRLTVDAGGPTIALTSPQPGARVTTEGGVQVAGTVTDSHHRGLSVSVQGQQVEVDAQGRFSVTVPASAGVQHLTVEAQDGVQPSGARQELDVMWGRAFAQETSARISDPDGVQVRIAPTLLDQNRPIARRAGRSAQLPDLAGYLELVFQESDLTAMNDLDSLGDLVTSILAIDGVRLGSVAVDVMSIEQGVEVRLSLIGAEMDINGVLLVRPGTTGAAGVDGTLTLDASLSVRLSVDPQGAVELRGADIQITDLRSNVATRHTNIPLAEVQRAIQTRGGALRNHLEMILDTQLLRPFVVGSVPALVEGVFTGSQSPLEREDRDITGLDGRAAHVAKGGQSQGWTARTGAPLTWIGAQSWTRSGDPLLGTEGGMLQVRARGAAPAFDASAPLQLAVGLENFNAPLHSVWRSGGFQADLAQTLGPIYGAALESGTMNAALPPTVAPNADGDGLVLQVGQVEASFIIEGREVRVAGSVEVPVVAAVEGDALTLSVEGQAQTRVWFVSGDASLMPRVSQVFEAGLAALQRVAASTLDGSEVKLPSFDLSDTAQTSPRFGGASARATLEGGPDLRDGWLIVGLGQEITAGR